MEKNSTLNLSAYTSGSTGGRKIENIRSHIEVKRKEFQENEQIMREAYKRALSGGMSAGRSSNGHFTKKVSGLKGL